MPDRNNPLPFHHLFPTESKIILFFSQHEKGAGREKTFEPFFFTFVFSLLLFSKPRLMKKGVYCNQLGNSTMVQNSQEYSLKY